MDVKALYPSLTKEWAKKVIKLQVMNTKIMIEGIDWIEAALYLLISYEVQELEDEGLMQVVHRRRHSAGQKQGITSARVMNGLDKDSNGEEKSWLNPIRPPDQEEKRKMLALTIVAGVMSVMNNHTYRVHNRIQPLCR